MKTLLFLSLLFTTIFAFAQDNLEGITFPVDSVKQNAYPLPSTDFRNVAQNKFRQILFTIPSSQRTEKVIPTRFNGFVEAIHVAYDEHRPLVLSPDAVWLTICQAFGNHIAVNADALKAKLMEENAPDTVKVFIRDLSQENEAGWDQLVDGFNDSLRIYLKGNPVDLVNQEFSTTTPIIAKAYQITLMDAVKSYFSFEGGSGCGIPSITLLGTTEDWQQIYDQLDQFNSYGLEFWTKELKPVIQEFIAASKGRVNISFWKAIYKHEMFYGAWSVTGWIHKFFPYLDAKEYPDQANKEDEREVIETYRKNPFLHGQDHLLSDISTFDFPKGYVSVPFVWKEFSPLGELIAEHELTLNAGFLGMQQNQSGGLSPFISWCLTETNVAGPDDISWEIQKREDSSLVHNDFQWIPGVLESVEELPIYNPERNTTYKEGVNAFIQSLKTAGFSSNDQSTLEIIVAIDGTAFIQNIEGPLKRQAGSISQFLSLSEARWTPAKGKRLFPPELRKPMPCNYKFEIKL